MNRNSILSLVKNTVQVQGGLMNLFSGQSALQHEFGYNLGRFMSKLKKITDSGYPVLHPDFILVLDLETTVGLSTGTQIPPFKDAWKVPMALLGLVL